MKWICDDMRSLEGIEDESVDVVIEKAAIESLLAKEKVSEITISSDIDKGFFRVYGHFLNQHNLI